MSASGSYSTAADAQRPALKLKAEIADASFSTTFDQLDVVRRMVPLFEKTGGDYSMSLDLATRLTQTMDSDYATLQADGAIRSKNIRVQNIAVFDQLAAALKNDALRRIEAKDVDIRFTIRDGRIATQPFDLSVGGISLNLSGSTGLDQTIDYTARVTLPEGSAGGILRAVDVGIGGSFSSPKITLDVKNAVKDAVSNAIGEKLGRRSDRPRANRPTISAPMRRPKAISSSRRPGRSATNSSGRRRANWPGSRRRPAATRWCRPPRSRRRNSWNRPSSRSPRSNSSRRSILGEGRFRIRKRPSRVGISGFRNDSRR